MKKVFRLVLLLIFIAPISYLAQRPKAVSVPTLETAEVAEKSDPVNDFYKNGLPDAEILGGSPSPELAAEVARRVSEYDEDSLPVLIAALQKAGFYIIDSNGKTLYRPISGEGMGMAFYDFEVVGMLKASGLGGTVSLERLTQTIAGDNKLLPAAKLPPLIMRDLNTARKSSDLQVAFLAALIFEFGKNSPVPLLIEGTPPDRVNLNIIQASLIERIVLRDFIRLYESFDFAGEKSGFIPDRLFKREQQSFRFVNAAWSPSDDDPCMEVGAISSFIKAEKAGKKVTETVKIYKEVMKSIENTAKNVGQQDVPTILTDAQDFFRDYGKGISIFNAAMSWVKLVVALSHVKPRITVQDPMPLIRTKSGRNSGQERTVTAGFTMEIANTEMINCAGKALSIATGISFSVPDGGPMADKPVSWEVVMSGSKYGKWENTPVWVDALTKSDITKQQSDANGESTIKLTGKPQPRDLENEAVVPLAKKADLKVSIALEKMDFKTDGPKIGKLGLGAKIDPLSIIEMIPDMLGKMKLSSFRVTVPIRDWQPCTADWGGYVTYKKELSQTIMIKASGALGNGIRQITELIKVNATLNPRTPEEMTKIGPKKADMVAEGKRSDVTEIETAPDICCKMDDKEDKSLIRYGTIEKYSTVQKGTLDVRYKGTERDHSLSLNFGIESFTAHKTEFKEILRSSCVLDEASAYSRVFEYPFALGNYLPDGRYGGREDNSAGTILQGKKTQDMPDGSKITWEWALAKCNS